MTTATEASLSGIDATSEFGSHLLQLVGESFLFLRRSYGDELVLHFGERVLGPKRRTKNGEFQYEHGSHSLHLRGSAWVVKGGQIPTVFSGGLQTEIEKVVGEPVNRASIETVSPIAAGARVTGVIPFLVERSAVKGIGVRIDLSDGSSVVIVPTPDEPPEPAPEGTTLNEIADWELHSPRGTLQIGPGLKWHFALPRPDTETAAPSATT